MSTVPNDIIPAAPMTNAVTDTGQMRVKALARALHESCSRQDIDGYLAAKIDCTVLAQVVLATLEADAGRGEVGRLTSALKTERSVSEIMETMRDNQVRRADIAIARAEAAEAKLAALSQPAPVVEDGKAREAGERYSYTGEQNIAFGPACRANPRREGETVPDYEDRIRGVLGLPVLRAFRATLAPEGQSAEASLRAALLEARSGLCAYTGGVDGACSKTIERIDAALAQSVSQAETAEEA